MNDTTCVCGEADLGAARAADKEAVAKGSMPTFWFLLRPIG